MKTFETLSVLALAASACATTQERGDETVRMAHESIEAIKDIPGPRKCKTVLDEVMGAAQNWPITEEHEDETILVDGSRVRILIKQVRGNLYALSIVIDKKSNATPKKGEFSGSVTILCFDDLLKNSSL